MLGLLAIFAVALGARIAVVIAAVVPIAMLGAVVRGWACGLFAAAIAALHPGLWLDDGMLRPEGLYALLVSTALVASYAVLARWHPRAAAVTLGLSIGLGALARGEGLLMLLSHVLPLALWAPLPRRRGVLVAAVVAMLTIMPWSIYNLARLTILW